MRLLKVFAFMLLAYASSAQALKVPTASPLQTLKQEFGLSSVEIEYSRPSAKGRKVMGDLVPYGKVWRTGANTQTLITFGDDVKVNGVDIKAGKYTILSIPTASDWEILFCKPTASVFNYKESDVIAKVKASSSDFPMYFETLMFVLGDQSDSSLQLTLLWENTAVQLEITTDIDAKVMSNIEKVMNNDSKPYHAAASYYYDNGKDLKKALEWVNMAVASQPDAFWVSHLKAKIQAKAGDKKGAIATAKASLAQAEKANNGDYKALNQKLIDSLK